jgi:hypothetical protein
MAGLPDAARCGLRQILPFLLCKIFAKAHIKIRKEPFIEGIQVGGSMSALSFAT